MTMVWHMKIERNSNLCPHIRFYRNTVVPTGYVSSMAASVLHNGRVSTERVRPTEPKTFTYLWPFTENVF